MSEILLVDSTGPLFSSGREEVAAEKAESKEVVQLDRAQQKVRGNAPKKIKTIEKKASCF